MNWDKYVLRDMWIDKWMKDNCGYSAKGEINLNNIGESFWSALKQYEDDIIRSCTPEELCQRRKSFHMRLVGNDVLTTGGCESQKLSNLGDKR